MASVNNTAFQMNATRIGKDNSFRRFLRSRNCFGKHIVIGRYYIAAMLFILNIISTWKILNFSLSIFYAKYDYHFFSPAVQNWTEEDHRTFSYGILGGQICVQIPVALLIYLTSSHKFLTAAVAISSVFHMLMPVVGNLHSSCLMILLCAHYIVEAPLRIAILSIWKDWAPPGGQTIFVFISFSSLILGVYIALSMNFLTNVIATQGSFYLSGACGLVWSLFWFFTVSDSPENIIQCPQNEQSCQQNNTLSAVKNRLKITNVPWKRILMSKPVFALCLMYFKIGGSSFILHNMSINFAFLLQFDGHISFTSYHIIFAALYTVILFSSAITTDFFSRKYPRKITSIKKGIFCTVLIIHGTLLLGTLYRRIILQTIILSISYFIFSISIPGFITNALELSTKYVVIIGGFIETFYHLGLLVSQYYMAEIYTYLDKHQVDNLEGKRLLYEVAVAIFVAVIFLIWGSVVEQPWSLNTASSHTSANTETHITSEEHELSAAPSNILEVC